MLQQTELKLPESLLNFIMSKALYWFQILYSSHMKSFPRWETDSKISCEQTLQKGDGPKTAWTRELTNDGELILVNISCRATKIPVQSGWFTVQKIIISFFIFRQWLLVMLSVPESTKRNEEKRKIQHSCFVSHALFKFIRLFLASVPLPDFSDSDAAQKKCWSVE